MSAKTYHVNDASIVAELFDNEAVVMNLADGLYYTLSNTAAEVWSMIEAGMDTDAMAARLSERHGVPLETCKTDLAALCKDLVDESIVLEGATGSAKPLEDIDFGPYVTLAVVRHTDMADVMAMDPPLPELTAATDKKA